MPQPPINAAALVVGVDDFRALERSRLRALVDKDMPLARQLHAADFQLVTPTGSMYSRDRYLGEIESGQLTYFVWEPGPIEVRLNPTMALLRYPARIEVDSGAGRSAAFRCWHTDSYELIDGFWQLVWSQATATR